MQVLLLAAIAVAAEPDFRVELPGEFSWYQVTSSGTLLVGVERAVVGIDPHAGTVAWERSDLAGIVDADIKAGPDGVFVHDSAGTVHALDVNTGQDQWSIHGGPVVFTQQNPKDDGLFVLTREPESSGDFFTMHYVDRSTGEERWSKPHYFGTTPIYIPMWRVNPDKKWSLKQDAQKNQPLKIVDAGAAYLELWHPKMGLTKRDLNTGEVLWSRPAKYKEQGVPTPGNGRPELQVTDDKVYVTDNYRRLWAYSLKTGEPVWSEKRVRRLPGTIHSVQPVGDLVLVAGDNAKKSYAAVLDATTGRRVWKRVLSIYGQVGMLELIDGGPLVAAEVNEFNTVIHTVRLADGERAEKIRIPGGIIHAEVHNGKLYATGSSVGLLTRRGPRAYLGVWDLATREQEWIQWMKGAIPSFLLTDDRVIFVDSLGQIHARSRATGELIYTAQLSVEGAEDPPVDLHWVGDRVVTHSAKSVYGVDPSTGTTVFEAHHSLPDVLPEGILLSYQPSGHANPIATGYHRYSVPLAYRPINLTLATLAEPVVGFELTIGPASSPQMESVAQLERATSLYFFAKGPTLGRVDLSSGDVGPEISVESGQEMELDEEVGVLYSFHGRELMGWRL